MIDLQLIQTQNKINLYEREIDGLIRNVRIWKKPALMQKIDRDLATAWEENKQAQEDCDEVLARPQTTSLTLLGVQTTAYTL